MAMVGNGVFVERHKVVLALPGAPGKHLCMCCAVLRFSAADVAPKRQSHNLCLLPCSLFDGLRFRFRSALFLLWPSGGRVGGGG
jgi:hypothetical protein